MFSQFGSAGNCLSGTLGVAPMVATLPASTNSGHFNVMPKVSRYQQYKVVSTDPPYYDNIGYADLSDFFYVWLRRSLRPIFPKLYATLAVPKAEELIATPYRHGSKQAEVFFLDGMTAAMHNLAAQAHPAFPVTIYYAFKQSDTKERRRHPQHWLGNVSGSCVARWLCPDRHLAHAHRAGCNRMIGIGTNALASSIVLVCRKRDAAADTISRREFQRQLREHLPEALETMIGGTSGQSPIAPVDLAQAAIGPGMAIYSQYAGVLNQDGTPMTRARRAGAHQPRDHRVPHARRWQL
jgi:putative DNA methylase